jgi:molecular chaperone IbpA
MTQNLSFTTFDLPALHRHAIGFDRIFDELNRHFANSKSDGNYPPYNILKLDDTHFVVELAVAGFEQDEIDVEVSENVLTVRGERKTNTEKLEPVYLHRGISAKNFSRVFTLADNMKVATAMVTNGILAIALEQIVPEDKKPKKIAVTFA